MNPIVVKYSGSVVGSPPWWLGESCQDHEFADRNVCGINMTNNDSGYVGSNKSKSSCLLQLIFAWPN